MIYENGHSIVMALISGLVMSGITYPTLAKVKGWPRGGWLETDSFYIYFGGGMIATLFCAWHVWGWWGPFAIIPISMVMGFILTQIFRRHIQIIALLGPSSALVWYFLTL